MNLYQDFPMFFSAWGKTEKKGTWRAEDKRRGGWESPGIILNENQLSYSFVVCMLDWM